MDERTLRALEFPRVLERLSSFCLSEAGKEAALRLRPMDDAEDVRRSQYLYDEIRDWFAEGDFSLVSFPDISGLLAYVRGHADPLLEMDGLWALKSALGLARRGRASRFGCTMSGSRRFFLCFFSSSALWGGLRGDSQGVDHQVWLLQYIQSFTDPYRASGTYI